MRLTYAGCNLFGQVPSSRELSIDQFTDVPLDDGLVDLALGHSISVYLRKDGVFFHGHGLQPKVTHQITKLEVPTKGKLKAVKTCDTNVYLLDDAGAVFVLDFLSRSPGFIQRMVKMRVPGVEDKVVDFVPGSTINVGRTESGLLYKFPDRLDLQLEGDAVVKKLTSGYEHCTILDTMGRVYTFGNGRRGQLGNGTLDIQKNPCKIDILDGIFIVDIASGGWHSMALSREGDVYIWGWNSDGQIGLLDENRVPFGVVHVPQYLPLPDDNLNIAHIAAGGRHSICITSDHKVYAFGCNKFNQLGLPDIEMMVNEPVKVYEVPKERKILRVECGPSSTAILTEQA